MRVSVFHQAVLLREAVDALNICPQGTYIDGTFGRGGHSAAILEALGPDGRLLALDRDPEAEQYAKAGFRFDARFYFERARLSQLARVAVHHKVAGKVRGILLDLGVSSPQLDDPSRGFSFVEEGPLDMRMDPTAGISAAEWLATAGEANIARVLKDFGEERFHRRIARAIVEARRVTPIIMTTSLAQIIAEAMPVHERGKHPATRSFQALRIFLNQELEELKAALEQTLQVLAPGGRLVAIAFHSLEDRIVKRFMREQARGPQWPPELPVPVAQSHASLRVIGRTVRPSADEIRFNPRSRSAVMRVAERL